MLAVIVDQDPLCRCHRALDRRKLAGDVEAGLLVFDHADHMPKVPFGTFQPLDQIGMTCMMVEV